MNNNIPNHVGNIIGQWVQTTYHMISSEYNIPEGSIGRIVSAKAGNDMYIQIEMKNNFNMDPEYKNSVFVPIENFNDLYPLWRNFDTCLNQKQ